MAHGERYWPNVPDAKRAVAGEIQLIHIASRVRASAGPTTDRDDRVRGFVLHCWPRALGVAVLLRFHDEAIWLEPGPGDVRKRAEQIGDWTRIWLLCRLDSRCIAPASQGKGLG